MSLENSQYTFHSLQAVNRSEFQREVDRITKEVDQDVVETAPVPAKRGRFSQSQGSDSSSQSQSFSDQHRAVSGTILSVSVQNFLCHESMNIDFNPEINFVVGRNGSGKSAILTALVVALGGSATTSGRGAALKDFVKHGCTSAKVSLSINNAGALSYKKEEYGDRIIVERTLSSQGGSSIKLKSERGKQLSSKMEDLRAMTLQLGIQVDNPISVLDQNTARHFLNQSKPNNKFELFMRATNLETLQRIYLDIALHVDRIQQEIKKKERQLVDNNEEVQEAQRKWQILQNLDKDRAKSFTLQMELLWAETRDSMQKLGRAQQDLEKMQREKESLDGLMPSENQTEPILQDIESTKAERKSLEEQSRDVDVEIKALKSKYTANSARHKRYLQEKQQIEIQIKESEKEIEEFRNEIKSQEQKMLPEHVESRRKQREKIHDLKRSLDQLQEIRRSKEEEARNLQRKAAELREQLEQLRRSKRRHEEELRALSAQLQGLEGNESNLSLFGPNMPTLVRQIENSNKFRKKPVGPLGAYVKVTDPKWALAVESAMKSRLNTFIVDNLEDERLLQNMIRSIFTRGQKPSVVRTPFPTTPIDTSRSAARTSEYCNVLDVVEINNLVAKNVLIEFCRLESTMLIPTDDECYTLLHDLRTVPRNCARAYTLNADSYMPAPRYGSYASNQHSVTILQTSRADIIRQTQLKIQDVQETIRCVENNQTVSTEELRDIQRQCDLCKQELKQMSINMTSVQQKLEQLRDIEQPDINSVTILREELDNKEQDLTKKKEKLQDIPAKMEQSDKEQQELKAMFTDKSEYLKNLKNQIGDLEDKEKELRDQLDQLQSARAGRRRKLEQLKKQIESSIKECKELEEIFNKAKREAEKLEAHHRSQASEKNIEFESMSKTERKLETIDKDLRAITRRLASVEKSLGQSAEVTERDFHEKLAAYNGTKKYIACLKKNAADLQAALSERKGLYHTQKKLMCGVVSHQFTRVLRYRNCTGNVRVNFEQKMLEITVGPVDEGERAGLGTTSLSGGERSYATMAFVIALWNVTELPFYFLDEFDVFMDMLNRQTVLTLLLKFAKQKCGYQFGFLTPLDTTAITGSDRVSIFQLADPER